MVNIIEKSLSILITVLLVVSIFAFYSLKWTGLLIPLSALMFFFVIGLYIGLERALMHASYYFSIAMFLALIIFGMLLLVPAWTFRISIALIILLVLSILVGIWRWYNGMLGRIQIHRWLTHAF